jgi:alpha-beta hydrolase superfamily lysophospholipase
MPLAATADLEASIQRGAIHLHVEHYLPVGDCRLVLVMHHGFSPHCGLYRHVGRALAGHGIAITQFDARGHGRSDGRRGHVDDFNDYLDDLQAVVEWARARNPSVPWALMGHSMGSAVTLAFALDSARNLQPSRLVMAAPWLKLKMKVWAPKRAAANVMARILPTFSGPNGLRVENITRHPNAREAFNGDPLVHHVATAGWFMTTLRAQTRLRLSAEKLRVPTLMLIAGDDRIVANETNLAFAKTAGDVVTVKTYDGLFHELFVEPEAETVIGDVARWLLQ